MESAIDKFSFLEQEALKQVWATQQDTRDDFLDFENFLDYALHEKKGLINSSDKSKKPILSYWG